VALAAGLVLGVAPSQASPTVVTAEGGAEADSNIKRVETKPGQERLASPVGRLGAKVDHGGKAAGGAYVLHLSGLARVAGNPDAQSESVALLLGDVKWVRSLGKRPVAAGFGVAAADAASLGEEEVDSRTFRSLGADGLLVLRGGSERSLTVAFGARRFTYKTNRKFDWVGPAVNARLDVTLWQPSEGTRSVELAAFAGIEARAYDSVALANAPCPDSEVFEDVPSCPAGTSLPRRDRYHRVGAEVTWVGRVVAALGYQLSVTDSNSFGQSLVRHRVNLSATTSLPWRLFGTALATLQFDQYLDGLLVQEDLQNQTFTTLDDENRSSLQLRLARPVSEMWSIESRAAIWRDLDGDNNTTFRRAIVYVGAVYSR
jgi:hypothetical protein